MNCCPDVVRELKGISFWRAMDCGLDKLFIARLMENDALNNTKLTDVNLRLA
ncbi:MAG: hypothetical protein LBT09_07815 [Planctomycetaceae bacterium]|nr:hypothetical protein [Planctomycetaceae bacterium]